MNLRLLEFTVNLKGVQIRIKRSPPTNNGNDPPSCQEHSFASFHFIYSKSAERFFKRLNQSKIGRDFFSPYTEQWLYIPAIFDVKRTLTIKPSTFEPMNDTCRNSRLHSQKQLFRKT